jgi:hypothetical protein
MLLSGSGDQLCNPLPALLWKWLVSVFVSWDFHTGGLFLCPVPFLWGRLCPTCPLCWLCFIAVCCLLFSFAGQFCFGCCSLAQEMSSVILYFPCFRESLIASLLSVFTAFPVFVYWQLDTETSSFLLPLSLVHFQCSTSAVHATAWTLQQQ